MFLQNILNCQTNKFTVQEGEQLCDLQLASLSILQKQKGFRFGFDAVALADFCTVRPHERAADLGTGTGVLPLLLFGREQSATFDAVEIDEQMADMARRSMIGNGVEGQIRVFCHDLRDVQSILARGAYSLVVMNPPYAPLAKGPLSPDFDRQRAMAEVTCTLFHAVEAAKYLLKFGGRFCLCLPPNRLAEAACILDDMGIEPKRLRFIHSYLDKAARLVLLEGVFGGKAGLTVMPPLIVYADKNVLSDEVKRIYHM